MQNKYFVILMLYTYLKTNNLNWSMPKNLFIINFVKILQKSIDFYSKKRCLWKYINLSNLVKIPHRGRWCSRDLQWQSSIWSDVTAINRQPLPPLHHQPPLTENSNADASEAVLGLIEYQMNPKSYGIQYVSTTCKLFLSTLVTDLCVSYICAFYGGKFS